MLIIGCDFRTRYQQIAMANARAQSCSSSDDWRAADPKNFLGGWPGPPAKTHPFKPRVGHPT
jgi:hypothetical protein